MHIANPNIELRIAMFHGQLALEKFIEAVLVKHGAADQGGFAR
jgi:hypothetical protein